MANDGKRFIKGSGIAKHREWRGLKDTFYDYTQWVVNLGLLVQFVAKSPVRIMRGMLEYRWLGSYLGSLNMVDKCMAGMRGPALRVSHTQMHAIMKGATQMIADSMKGDRRFGDTKYADKFVMLEQTMCPEIIAGFPKLKALPLEVRCDQRRVPPDRRMPRHEQYALRLFDHEPPAHRAPRHDPLHGCGHPDALGGLRNG